MTTGTYTDQVNGGTLTVSGGKITSGTATPRKVSVFYNMKTNVASVSATGSASFKTDTTTVTLRASNVTGAMGTESTSKTATGRSAIVEGKYDAGTTTLTVKATRADGTVLTAQKTLVNLGSGTWNNSYWYPADSLALSGNGLTGTPDDANDDGVCTMTINAGTSTQITTSVTPAKANQHAIWYRPAGEDKDIATIDADGTVYAHKADTIKYVAYTPSRSVLLTITVK